MYGQGDDRAEQDLRGSQLEFNVVAGIVCASTES